MHDIAGGYFRDDPIEDNRQIARIGTVTHAQVNACTGFQHHRFENQLAFLQQIFGWRIEDVLLPELGREEARQNQVRVFHVFAFRSQTAVHVGHGNDGSVCGNLSRFVDIDALQRVETVEIIPCTEVVVPFALVHDLHRESRKGAQHPAGLVVLIHVDKHAFQLLFRRPVFNVVMNLFYILRVVGIHLLLLAFRDDAGFHVFPFSRVVALCVGRFGRIVEIINFTDDSAVASHIQTRGDVFGRHGPFPFACLHDGLEIDRTVRGNRAVLEAVLQVNGGN